MSLRENAFALEALSSNLRPAGFDESKRVEEADEESVAEDRVRLDEIVE